MPNLPSQRTAGARRTGKFFYFELRVPPRCTASLWVTSLGTRIQCGGTLSLLPSGTDSLVVCSDTVYSPGLQTVNRPGWVAGSADPVVAALLLTALAQGLLTVKTGSAR